MSKLDLERLVQSLCADDAIRLQELLKKNANDIITAKDSNHKIIRRERSVMHCPFCHSLHIVKNGTTRSHRQKYICQDCNKSFSDTTETIVFRSKKTYDTWEKYIDCLLKGMTLTDTAHEVGISVTTAFTWRHKIFKTLSSFNKTVKLGGQIQVDATYLPINLKGTKKNKMPRFSKKRSSSAYRGISHHKICIMTASDDEDNTLFEVTGLGPETTDMLTNLKNRFKEKSMLITDSKAAYIQFANDMKMILKQVPSGFHKTESGESLATINGLHGELKGWLRAFRGVSTRHLQGYLDFFRFLKHLKYRIEYEDRADKAFCTSIPSQIKYSIDNVYLESFPINLKEAYGEYHFGIYA